MEFLEPYSLKLSDFDSNFIASVADLRNSKELFDVTLFSDEETPFQAHKLVLSASSSVFRNIFKFKQNSSSSPLLYIRGLSNKDLTNVIEFLYKGEVVIACNDVEMFLKVSKDLKLRGMFEENYELSKFDWLPQEELITENITENKKSIFKRKENSIFESYGHSSRGQKSYQQFSVKHNGDSHTESNVEIEQTNLQDIENDKVYEDNEDNSEYSKNSKTSELNRKIIKMMFRNDKIWTCKACGLTRNKKSHMQSHVEIKHVDNPQSCNFCENVSKNRPSLATHIRKNHSVY